MDGALAGKANVEVFDFDEIAHAGFGHPVVEIGGALERRADTNQHGFIERTADELHAHRQAVVGKTRGNRKRRQSEIVDRAREPGHPLDHRFRVVAVADIALGDGRRRHRRDRRDHRIGAVDGREVGRQRRTAPAHRFQIGHGRYRQSVLQPHEHLRAVILRPFDHPSPVEGGGLGREHELAGRGELALVGQFDLDDLGAFLLEHRQGLVEHARDLGIEIVDVERGGHADPQSLDRLLRRGHVIRHRQGRRGRIFGVGARHQPHQQRAVLDDCGPAARPYRATTTTASRRPG